MRRAAPRTIPRSSVLLCLPLLVTGPLAAGPVGAAQDPAPVAADPLPALLARVDPARLKADVETLVGFHTRHVLSASDDPERGIDAAADWLRASFEEISRASGGRLEVFEQEFTRTVAGREVTLRNVGARLLGTDVGPDGRTYVYSGHYDSRASRGMDGESFAPGANDDASGTAVALELARVLAPGEYRANLVFLCVSGEELGLYGAQHFAEDALGRGVELDGMITGDIVGGVEGGDGARAPLTIRCFSDAEGLHSPSRELARNLVDSAARYVADARVRMVLRLDRFGRGGDHIPFHEAGVPALRLSEAHEHYDRQHQDVREEDGVAYGDVPEHVSGDYMALVARVVGATLGELALAPPAPDRLRLRAAVSYDTQLSWSPSPGAPARYQVVWRDTAAATWERALDVSGEVETLRTRSGEREVVRATVEGVTADTHFFGVRALSPAGHRSRTAYPDRP